MSRVSFLLALICLPLIIGCEGCRRETEDENPNAAAPLPEFTARPPQPFPAGDTATEVAVKPGHWFTAAQALRSNRDDNRGELFSRIGGTGNRLSDGVTTLSDGELTSKRPVVLPKGQLRKFQYRILAPRTLSGTQRQIYLNSQLLSPGGALLFDTGRQPFNALSPEEYFFVILTTRPERFNRLQVADWVRRLQGASPTFEDLGGNYQIVIPATDGLLPLPESMLDWTSTSVVLWDDLPPESLTPAQQTAIADWIRFGGQLIVNGAPASTSIGQTRLAEVLPLQPSGNIELSNDAAIELLQSWAVESDRTLEKQFAALREQSGRIAIDGSLAEGAVAVKGTGDLVIERRLGHGRVIQPRFDVSASWITDWESYDSFFNAVLLGRPRRELKVNRDAATGVDEILQVYPDVGGTRWSDPTMNTRFRLSARDAVLRSPDVEDSLAAKSQGTTFDPFAVSDSVSGVGGWDDNSDAMQLGRDVLKNESGIDIPESSLVIRSLGWYLLILVPINYVVFRLLGRLEYAWLAVPVIALIGAVWVARAARLDIGFARSQTEVAILELQPGYGRGHLSRLVAIYNSLSSTYDVQFKTSDAVASPIEANPGERPPIFLSDYAEGPQLSNVSVASNTVRTIHAEELFDVGGPIGLDANGQLVNGSKLTLENALVVRKLAEGETSIAWIGQSPAGSTQPVDFAVEDLMQATNVLPEQTQRLIRWLASPASMPSGSTRLVAEVPTSIGGMTITPTAGQQQSFTVVLAHLEHPPLADRMPDVNLLHEMPDLAAPIDLLDEPVDETFDTLGR